MTIPLDVPEASRLLFGTLRAEIRGLARALNVAATDEELRLEIERRWGDRILREVCLPNGYSQGECLVIASAIARET